MLFVGFAPQHNVAYPIFPFSPFIFSIDNSYSCGNTTMRRLFFSSLLLCTLVLFSCSKDDNPVTPTPNTPNGVIKVGEQTSEGVRVELFALNAIATGYNKFYVRLTDVATTTTISDAHVHLVPVMDMGTMKHSSPVEQPDEMAVGGLFPCAIVFTMPESDTQKWTVRVDVHNHTTGKDLAVTFPLAVHNGAYERTKTFVGSDGVSYVVTMMCLCDATVGMNTAEFLVHRKQDMMAFPPVADLTLVMTPDMPSMGHGSPNNIDPVHKGNGHYEGKVNFTMTGEWRIQLELRQGSTVLGTTAFTTSL